MIENVVTKKKYCESREELGKKYFGSLAEIYAKNNMGIVTLLSDVQHNLSEQYWIDVLNDIKAVLITDIKEERC